MAAGSPIAEGFRQMVRQPLAGLAEIIWRWTAAGLTFCLLGFFLAEYIQSLPVDSVDLLLLRSGNWWLIGRALAHVLSGSAPRFWAAAKVVVLVSTVAWILLASFGRAATLRALLNRDRVGKGHFRSLIALNFLRALVACAALLAIFAVALLASRFSTPDVQSINAIFSLAMGFGLLIFFAWFVVNWFLSAATIFVVRDGFGWGASIAAAANWCGRHLGPILAASSVFGLAHCALWVAASGLALLPLTLLSVVPIQVVIALLGLLTLGYFSVADYLYIGRLAAYLAIAEPEPPSAAPPAPAGPVEPPVIFPVPDFSPQP
jgi:hypothetical protein